MKRPVSLYLSPEATQALDREVERLGARSRSALLDRFLVERGMRLCLDPSCGCHDSA